MYDGLGQGLLILGILTFLLLFYCNLRTIKEPQKIQKSWTPFSSPHFFKACLVALFICTMTVFFQNDSIIITHIQLLLYIATLGIFIPKYYISQDDKLQLYVNVYHQIPAPVLPWQLPNNFDPNSVQLEIYSE